MVGCVVGVVLTEEDGCAVTVCCLTITCCTAVCVAGLYDVGAGALVGVTAWTGTGCTGADVYVVELSPKIDTINNVPTTDAGMM